MSEQPPEDNNSRDTGAAEKDDTHITRRLNRQPGQKAATVLGAGLHGEVRRLRRGETTRIRLVPAVSDSTPWRVIFAIVHPVKGMLGIDVRQGIIVGRADQDEVQPPDVDLASYHASDFGVSRHHAALVPTEDALAIVDLESKNGTWINGRYLTPGDRYRLNPGDVIELGLLRLEVRSINPLSRS